jgi:hypothetical protein
MRDRRSVEKELAKAKSELEDVRGRVRELFVRERQVAAQVKALENMLKFWDLTANSYLVSAQEHQAIDQAGVLPPEGTVLRMAAELLLRESAGLHVDQLRHRLAVIGVKVSKASITASMDKRARQGLGFQRVIDHPNTFRFVLRAPETSRQRDKVRGRRRRKEV